MVAIIIAIPFQFEDFGGYIFLLAIFQEDIISGDVHRKGGEYPYHQATSQPYPPLSNSPLSPYDQPQTP